MMYRIVYTKLSFSLPSPLLLHTHTANLAVIISSSSESRLVLAGNTTTLVATVHAHPSPDTAGWYLNGNQIFPGDHDGTIYSFTMNSTMYTLRIQNIQASRLGLYEFVATVGNQTASDGITLSFPGAFDQTLDYHKLIPKPPFASSSWPGNDVKLGNDRKVTCTINTCTTLSMH